jgi:hypothetical protein
MIRIIQLTKVKEKPMRGVPTPRIDCLPDGIQQKELPF